jgi:hypothetical protein
VDYDAGWTDDDSESFWGFGGEISILRFVQARIGRYDREGLEMESFGFGLGWEFGRWMIRGDYARQSWNAYLDDNDSETAMLGLAAGVRF